MIITKSTWDGARIITPDRLLYYLLKGRLVLNAQQQGYGDFLEKIEAVVGRYDDSKDEVWQTARHIAEFTLYYVQTHYRLQICDDGGVTYHIRPKEPTRSAFSRLLRAQNDCDDWAKTWLELGASARELIFRALRAAGKSTGDIGWLGWRVMVPIVTVDAIRVDEVREDWPFEARDGFTVKFPIVEDIVPFIDAASRLPRQPSRAKPEREDAIRKIIGAYHWHTQARPGHVPSKRSHKELMQFIFAIEECYSDLWKHGFGGMTSKSVFEKLYRNATAPLF